MIAVYRAKRLVVQAVPGTAPLEGWGASAPTFSKIKFYKGHLLILFDYLTIFFKILVWEILF